MMNSIKTDSIDVLELSPLALAFLGDSIHTFFVREYILKKENLLTGNYHLKAVKFCKAKKQAEVFDRLLDNLNEDEKRVALRARNHKSHTAKNASPEEYKKATAYEALIGYLYLTGKNIRMKELLEEAIKE